MLRSRKKLIRKGNIYKSKRQEILNLTPGSVIDFLVAKKLGLIFAKYSTDISQAWKVRQWLLDNVGGVKIESHCHNPSEYCEVYMGKEHKTVFAYGYTAAEAICKVALLLERF